MLPGTTLQMHLFRPRLIPTIEALPKTQTHREVDLGVVAANTEGYVRTYNPYSKFPVSFQPDLTEIRVELRSNAGPDDTGYGREGYDFGENGQHQNMMQGKNSEAMVFTGEELQNHFGGRTIERVSSQGSK
ncbi:hypothetical protein BDR03DRAFT_980098 [Suillus americanus]|nr:hypothetical protein BDR03DRAFT_980098 [Suillus americanus]